MVRRVLSVLLLAASVGLLGAFARAQVATENFSVTIERAGNKWSVECPEGCPFKTASVTVADPATPMRIDNGSIKTAVSPYHADVRYSFTLTPRGNGWDAVAINGTQWKTLSADCAFSPCRATVTEHGVGVEHSRR